MTVGRSNSKDLLDGKEDKLVEVNKEVNKARRRASEKQKGLLVGYFIAY